MDLGQTNGERGGDDASKESEGGDQWRNGGAGPSQSKEEKGISDMEEDRKVHMGHQDNGNQVRIK